MLLSKKHTEKEETVLFFQKVGNKELQQMEIADQNDDGYFEVEIRRWEPGIYDLTWVPKKFLSKLPKNKVIDGQFEDFQMNLCEEMGYSYKERDHLLYPLSWPEEETSKFGSFLHRSLSIVIVCTTIGEKVVSRSRKSVGPAYTTRIRIDKKYRIHPAGNSK